MEPFRLTDVTQHERCEVELEVVGATREPLGEQNFKLTAVVVHAGRVICHRRHRRSRKLAQVERLWVCRIPALACGMTSLGPFLRRSSYNLAFTWW